MDQFLKSGAAAGLRFANLDLFVVLHDARSHSGLAGLCPVRPALLAWQC